jgi:hypothetical protein
LVGENSISQRNNICETSATDFSTKIDEVMNSPTSPQCSSAQFTLITFKQCSSIFPLNTNYRALVTFPMFGQRTAAFTRENSQSQNRAESLSRTEAMDLHEMSIGARRPIQEVISDISSLLDWSGDVDGLGSRIGESVANGTVG